MPLPCVGPALLCLLCAVAGAGSRVDGDERATCHLAWAPAAPVEPEAPVDVICEDDVDPDDPERGADSDPAQTGGRVYLRRPADFRIALARRTADAPTPFDRLARLSRLQI